MIKTIGDYNIMKEKPLSEYSETELQFELNRRKEVAASQTAIAKVHEFAGSPVGFWKVTTEGDCEGRSIRDLGVHEGHVADIAAALAGQAAYGLRFKKVNPTQEEPLEIKDKGKVSISLDINTGTWDLKKNRPAVLFSWLTSEPAEKVDFDVDYSNYYASVNLQYEKKKE